MLLHDRTDRLWISKAARHATKWRSKKNLTVKMYIFETFYIFIFAYNNKKNPLLYFW